MNKLREADKKDDTQRKGVLFNFCDSYGEGYLERKKLLTKIYQEENEDAFNTKCIAHLNGVYNVAASEFDPIDMSG